MMPWCMGGSSFPIMWQAISVKSSLGGCGALGRDDADRKKWE